ncbi:MAG: cobalamin-dependent protein [Planctomycetota bacterium]
MGPRRTMRILLIEAADNREEHLHGFSLLHLAYLAGFLREEASRKESSGHEIRILSAGSARAAADAAQAFKPDLVGLSSFTHCFHLAKAMARAIKAAAPVPIVVGGHHVSALPESLTPDMDVAVVGEGEAAFAEVAAAAANGTLSPDALRSIAGIAFFHEDRLHRTAPRNLVEPLDRLALPAWDLLEPINDKACVITSRGAPRPSFFSHAHRFWGGKVRYHSAERVAQEVKALLDRGMQSIHFSDACFASDPGRLEKLASLLGVIRSKRAAFSCHLQADEATLRTMDLLKEIGIRQVHLGLESGCHKTRSLLSGSTLPSKEPVSAIRKLHGAGFSVSVTLALGAPEESLAEAEQTLQAAADRAIASGEDRLLAPLPGTACWDLAASRGLVDSEMDWSRLDADFTRTNERAVIISEKMDLFQLWGLHERLHHIWNLKELDARRIAREKKRPLKRLRRSLLRFLGIRQPGQAIQFREMPLAKRYCCGQGLEIGASVQNPFGLPSKNVDLPCVAEVFAKHQETLAHDHVPVDIEAPADDIPVPDGSHDYVIHSHVLEHLPDPIKGLREWDRVVRPGGVIFMIVPHMERTIDRYWPRTPLKHVIEDFRKGTTLKDEPRIPGAHYHYWITEDVVEIIEWMNHERLVNWEIVEVEDVDSKVGNGFTVVCRKR